MAKRFGDGQLSLETDAKNIHLSVRIGLTLASSLSLSQSLLEQLFAAILARDQVSDWVELFENALGRLESREKGYNILIYQLAGLHWQMGEFDEAEKLFEKSALVAMRHEDHQTELGSRLGTALCKWANKNYIAAEEVLPAKDLVNRKNIPRSLKVRALAVNGMVAFAQRKYEDATKLFDKALEIKSSPLVEAQLRMNLGLALHADRKLLKSMRQYNLAAALLNESHGIRELQAKLEALRYALNMRRGKTSVAEAALNRAAELLELEPSKIRAEFFLEPGLKTAGSGAKQEQALPTVASKLWGQMAGNWVFDDPSG